MLESSNTLRMSIDSPSGGCAAMANTGAFVSPGSTTALTSGCSAPPTPPSISSGPLICESRCGCTANCFVPGCSSGDCGSVTFTEVTVTTCGIHQFEASNVKGAGVSVVNPSLCGVIVTVPVGALVSRTV